MSVLRRFVRRDIRSQTRISRGVEEVVRQSKGGRAVERKHGGIFGIVDGRRRGFGLSSGTGVHVLHRRYLINDRAWISVSRSEDTVHRMRECIMSAERERGDESARQAWRSQTGQVQGQEVG